MAIRMWDGRWTGLPEPALGRTAAGMRSPSRAFQVRSASRDPSRTARRRAGPDRAELPGRTREAHRRRAAAPTDLRSPHCMHGEATPEATPRTGARLPSRAADVLLHVWPASEPHRLVSGSLGAETVRTPRPSQGEARP